MDASVVYLFFLSYERSCLHCVWGEPAGGGGRDVCTECPSAWSCLVDELGWGWPGPPFVWLLLACGLGVDVVVGALPRCLGARTSLQPRGAGSSLLLSCAACSRRVEESGGETVGRHRVGNMAETYCRRSIHEEHVGNGDAHAG